jgi:hypothetical protein
MMAKKTKTAKRGTHRTRVQAPIDPADKHTYGEGSHTIGNVVIHGLGHYDVETIKKIATWLRDLANYISTEPDLPETFAARYNVAKR